MTFKKKIKNMSMVGWPWAILGSASHVSLLLARRQQVCGVFIILKVLLVFKMLYEFPGGNLVDGLPPPAHTGAGAIWRTRPCKKLWFGRI